MNRRVTSYKDAVSGVTNPMPSTLRVRSPLVLLADAYQPVDESSEEEEGEVRPSPKKQRRKTAAKKEARAGHTKAITVPEADRLVSPRACVCAIVISGSRVPPFH